MQVQLNMPQALRAVVEALNAAGAEVFCVGGAVRDLVFEQFHGVSLPVTDWDFEVFGLEAGELESQLTRFGSVARDQSEFPVFHLGLGGCEEPPQFSLPRRERPLSDEEADERGLNVHQAFDVGVDSSMSTREAAMRRDLTVNSLMANAVTGEVVDHFGGVRHLKELVAHPLPKFGEDPLRVLRAVGFVARLGLTPSEELVEVSRSLVDGFHSLSRERVGKEWNKVLVKGKHFVKAVRFLRECGWVEHFPELGALHGVPQSPKHHPEGNALRHSAMTASAMAFMAELNEWDDETRRLRVAAALTHDLGKAVKTEWDEDRKDWTSHGHESAGETLALNFWNRIFKGDSQKSNPKVSVFAAEMAALHMVQNVGKNTHRKVLKKMEVSNLDDLFWMCAADKSARPFDGNLVVPLSVVQLMVNAADDVSDSNVPQCPLMGRHLIDLGLEPGKLFGVLLKRAESAWEDGEFDTLPEALEWVKDQPEVK